MSIIHKLIRKDFPIAIISVTINLGIIQQGQIVMGFFPNVSRAAFNTYEFRLVIFPD